MVHMVVSSVSPVGHCLKCLSRFDQVILFPLLVEFRIICSNPVKWVRLWRIPRVMNDGFSLLDVSKGLLIVHVAPDFPPVQFSLTHFPPDLDFLYSSHSQICHPHHPRSRSSPDLFPFYTLSRIRFFSTLDHQTSSFLGLKKNWRKKKSQFFIVTHLDRGGIRHTLSGKVTCLCVFEDRGVSPILTTSRCQFPNLINFHPQTLLYQQLVDNTMVLSTVGWFLKILINSRYLITSW
jgi:hypothetical protein